MDKAPDAFRTISEVAAELDVPQHVLRFWESRFREIKPMKRGGGRRYYRPDDLDLLRGIRHLLYGEGYTIRGVQRLLREQGVRFVQRSGSRARRSRSTSLRTRTRRPNMPARRRARRAVAVRRRRRANGAVRSRAARGAACGAAPTGRACARGHAETPGRSARPDRVPQAARRGAGGDDLIWVSAPSPIKGTVAARRSLAPGRRVD